MEHLLSEGPVAFHLSMNVSSIDRSVAFFTKVFGTRPTKLRDDYAKFELSNPSITFSLEPMSSTQGGALNHVGFKLQSAAELVMMQRRLEMAGIRSEREEGVECCYAKQTKFWLHDPDGTLWEMYVLEGDIEDRGAGQDASAVTANDANDTRIEPAVQSMPVIRCASPLAPARPSDLQIWTHRLGTPQTIPDEFANNALDEVALQGTFNAANSETHVTPFLSQIAELLKPGGRLTLHCLTADRSVNQVLDLPGPASVVKTAPCLDTLIDELESTGFEQIRLTKYGSRACFTTAGAELRETILEAQKPSITIDTEQVTVIYSGPFPQLVLEDGTSLKRLRRTQISLTAFEQLKRLSSSASFTQIEFANASMSCTNS